MASITDGRFEAPTVRIPIPRRLVALVRLWRIAMARARTRQRIAEEMRDPRWREDAGLPPMPHNGAPMGVPGWWPDNH